MGVAAPRGAFQAFSRISGPVLLSMVLACAPAWHPPDAGRFSLVVPDQWAVTRNYRFLGTDTLVLARDHAAMSVTVRPDHGASATLPLDLVASVRALSWGRRLGVQNAVLGEQEIVVDGRRACAVTGLRRWRTATTGYTMVFARAPGQTVELVLHAPADELDHYAPEWGAFLDQFHLNAPPEPDGPPFSEDTWRR